MGTKAYTLCAVATGASYNQMQATVVTPDTGSGLPDDYTAFCPLVSGTVAAYAGGSGRLDVYAVPPVGQGFGEAVATQTLTASQDLLLPFTIGDQVMAMGYTAASGTFQFYSVTGTSFQALNTWSNASPTTASLTTVLPFLDWGGGTYVLCYDTSSGGVAIYQLSSGQDGVDVALVWQPPKLWAESWTRFGLFQFGPENFFIKTNVKGKTTFIDHIMDEPSQGTHPAAMHLPLPLDLTGVATFTLAGDPCFATYLSSSGAVTLNRFRGDLTGWNQGAEATAVSGGSVAVSLLGGSAPTVFFY